MAAERTPLTFVRFGPSQRFLRGLRPLVSVGPLPLPESAGAHASRRSPQPAHHNYFKKTGQVILVWVMSIFKEVAAKV